MVKLNTTAVYRGKNSDVGQSPRIWGDCPADLLRNDFNAGFICADHFKAFHGSVSSNVGRYFGPDGGYVSYEDTSCSIAQLATERDGVVRLATTTTDNVEVWLMPGSATSVAALLSDSTLYKTWFEARVRFNSITDDKFGFFVGLAEEGLAAADTISDAGALADKDFVGFFRDEADGDQLDTVHNKAGAGGVTTVKADAAPSALVADTWVKLGLLYEPEHHDGARITYFVDGVALDDTIDASTFAAGFPDGEELHALFGLKNATNELAQLDVDWWQLAQLNVAA